MDGNEKLLIILFLAHVALAIWALRIVGKAPMWSVGKKTFAKITAWLIPIFGPLLIVIAVKAFGKSSIGDPNLPHSVDVLSNSNDVEGTGGNS